MPLAQVNIGRMLAPIDDPVMKGFVDNLDRINTLAENSPGFVWRLKDDSDNATSIRIFDDDFMIVNLTVWENIESLFDFAYKSSHTEILKRKSEWFERLPEMHYALWYVDSGHHPTVDEAVERLIYLRNHGETPYSFSFKKRFDPNQANLKNPVS